MVTDLLPEKSCHHFHTTKTLHQKIQKQHLHFRIKKKRKGDRFIFYKINLSPFIYAEAFYRLIGLLAGVSIDVRSNPLFDVNAKLDNQNPTPYDVRTSNTVVRIESRLPGLLGSVGSIGIQAECRMRKKEISYARFMPMTTQTSILNEIPPIKAQRPFPDFLELYLDTPESKGSAIKKAVGYDLAVRAQFVLKTASETRYFPAPGVKDPTRYGPEYAKADFVKTKRPFWADEQTNKAN
ncbi:hypothetical protein PGC34_05450 [Pseudomonas kribbensis]|uniref:hypothetical protein n=1 Tax=Pseudomonas kribbensis TaxID=1628086 RepID=UPI003BF8D4FB